MSEIMGLTWGHVDLDNGIVRLETGETKNDEGRTVYLDDGLMEIFGQQWDSAKKSGSCPLMCLSTKTAATELKISGVLGKKPVMRKKS